MTDPLTDAQLAAAEAALTAEHVTPLPWVAADYIVYETNEADPTGWGHRVAEADKHNFERGDADARLIAAAVTALPALLAEVHRLRAALERQDGESRYWEVEYRAAMDNYQGEAREVTRLRGELEQARAQAAEDADDEWVRCSSSHCPTGERYSVAQRRGWTPAHMGTWLCPSHKPACPCGGEVVHQAGCEAGQ